MFGISGMHALVLLAVLVLMIAVATGIVFLGVFLARRADPGAAAVASAPRAQVAGTPQSSVELRVSRLAEIESLRAAGLLSEAESEAKRADILGEI